MMVREFYLYISLNYQGITVLCVLLSGSRPCIFKIIIMQLGMLKHHNYAVKAHYNYSVTEGVLKGKSISPLDVSV